MTEVARPVDVSPSVSSAPPSVVSPAVSPLIAPDDHPAPIPLSKESSTNIVTRGDSTTSLVKEKEVRFDEHIVDELQGHRRTPSGDKLAKLKTTFRKSDAPINKELNDRARSAPLVKKFALPPTETLVNDYSAALLKHILIHGRMYLSQNYICFESKIFGIKTMEVIPFKDVTHICKRSKKLKFAHGIEVTTSYQTYYFASFVSREKALETLTKIWREHVPKSDSHEDDEDEDEDDDGTTGTNDYESDDSTLKKKDKKVAKEHADLKLGRSVECPPEVTEEKEKGLRRFSSPLLNRVLPSSEKIISSKHNSGTASLSSSTTNLEMLPAPTAESELGSGSQNGTSPPKANPDIPSASAPTTPAPSPPESEDEEEGMYDEGDGFLGSEAPFHQILAVSFPVNVKTFYKIFFSDESTFTKTHHDARGDKDLMVKKWSNSPQFGLIRDVLFVSPVKNPLGPSQTRITETQRYHLTKNRLLIDTISMMLDIPYGDSFRVEGKWEVTLVTPDSCKLVVNIGVHFMKKTWFKGKIETGTIKETKESYQQWASLAPAEIAKYKASQPATSTSTPNPSPPASASSSTASLPSSRPAQNAPPATSPASSSASLPATSSPSPVPSTPSVVMHTQESHISQTSVSSFSSLEARRKSADSGRFAVVSRLFSNLPNPASGFSPTYILLVLFFAIFIHMYLRILYLEGRVDTLESILQPLLTQALRDKL